MLARALTVSGMRHRRGFKSSMHPPGARHHRRFPGFTLLELIVVIVILGILALLAIPTFTNVISKSHYASLVATGESLDHDATALAAYDQQSAAADLTAQTTAVGELPSTVTASAPSGGQVTLTEGAYSVCVTFSSNVNSPGTVSKGACGTGTSGGQAVGTTGAGSGLGGGTTTTTLPPPAAPTGLSATAGTEKISLSWTASSGATSYVVYRNGTQIATTTGSTTSYVDTTPAAGTSYAYQVAAVSSSGTSSLSNTASATATSAYQQAELADGAVAVWPLAKGSGTTTDLSGNGTTGTYTLYPPTSVPATTAAAAPYDAAVGGATALNNGGYINGTIASPVAGNYSITGWIYLNALPTLNDGGEPPFTMFAYYGASGFGVRAGGDLTVLYDYVSWQPTSTTISTGAWHFVALTMTSGGSGTIYVDGVAVAYTASAIASGSSVSVGGTVHDANRYLNGDVADFGFYNNVLSSAQIAALWADR